MGGTGSGGTRTGKTGTAYTNRTDLAAKPRAAAPAIPVGPPSSVPTSNPNLPIGFSPTTAPISAPNNPLEQSARPDEHVMHGSASGPGAGPEILPLAPDPTTDTHLFLKAMYSQNPDPDIARLLASYSERYGLN